MNIRPAWPRTAYWTDIRMSKSNSISALL